MFPTSLIQILVIFYLIKNSYLTAVRSESFGVQTPDKIGRKSKRAVTVVHSCPNLVYCQGDLLDTVQRHKLFKDSKTFVDMSQKRHETITLANFKTMMEASANNPSKSQVQTFVDENFEFVNESEYWTPPDFKESPAFLDKIGDAEIKKFAKTLVSLWPILGRKVKDIVKNDPNKHSLIPVPHGFVVPGGRFREVYYWDSYWIIEGLLLSEMTDTVKGMLDNFIYFIKTYGLIPNGSRIYYLNRSQPPTFTMMVGLYVNQTNDISWLKSNIQYIETELNFWLSNRTLDIEKSGVTYQLSHYGTPSNTPRPESYSEDLTTCSMCTHEEEKQACYNALKTAAETGWDFSTRWIFDENGGTKTNLSFIDSQRVLPVDLNAILCKSFHLLAKFYGQIGNSAKQKQWEAQADKWRKTIEVFLYNDEDGIWYDYDYDLKRQRKYFFASNFAPLWTDCYDLGNKEEQGRKAVAYFNKNGIGDFKGGVPTSLENSGEQWDLPNAWPPLQDFVVSGLYKTGYKEAQDIATDFAHRWIKANMIGYEKDKGMYEKYDAVTPGMYGAGGEYAVQLGFGWSNGVALSFINQFSSLNTSKTSSSPGSPKPFLSKFIYFLVFSLSLLILNIVS